MNRFQTRLIRVHFELQWRQSRSRPPASASVSAQHAHLSIPGPSLSDETGAPGLSLMLRKLSTVGTLMMTTAHPDDENERDAGLLRAPARGCATALVTATRGDGGQNEIGPELFDALGILRTEELLAAHQFDGAEQYFTRAVDFGYSLQPGRDDAEVGEGRDHRRLRASHPDDQA